MGICDERELVWFIARRTGKNRRQVKRFIKAHNQFQSLQHPGAPENQYEVVHFISRRTKRSFAEVANMYAEDVAYHVSKGLMEFAAYEYFRSWADALLRWEWGWALGDLKTDASLVPEGEELTSLFL